MDHFLVHLIYSAGFRHMHIMRAAFFWYSRCIRVGTLPCSSATVHLSFRNLTIVILFEKKGGLLQQATRNSTRRRLLKEPGRAKDAYDHSFSFSLIS